MEHWGGKSWLELDCAGSSVGEDGQTKGREAGGFRDTCVKQFFPSGLRAP